ncbi:MAG: hypothetical protein O6849_00470 [Candidatus Dadabacteria bacterium]|nr:hypothetical protein [Candidatus Dadabacteria bacterium]
MVKKMKNLDKKAFETMISSFVDTRDIKRLVDKCFKDRTFYYFVLKDLSRGQNSLNYKILQKVARKKKVSEDFIIEQTKSVLSYITTYDEGELDNYYEMLKGSPEYI